MLNSNETHPIDLDDFGQSLNEQSKQQDLIEGCA
jgi:hypothetical protein